MSSLLKARGVKKDFKSGSRVLHVLRGVDLEVKRGESVAVIGASGTGKSTLLHLLGALDHPTSGKISLEDLDYRSMSEPSLALVRNRRLGFIYQFHHLLPEFTALENVMVPGMIGSRELLSTEGFASYLWCLIHPTPYSSVLKDLRKRAEKILEEVGLGDRMTHRPARLSGGEQQRVALARALINDPDLVLADEPTGNLDLATGDRVFEIILERTVKSGKTLVMVTHNPDLASRMDSVYHLKNGVLAI